MYLFDLTITSKNKTSIEKFSMLFLKKLKTDAIRIHSTKKKEKIKFTILKSPHVNKTAQEQFEYRFFYRKIKIKTFKSLKILMILKEINYHLFPDISIKIKASNRETNFKIINPKNYNINNCKLNNYLYLKKYENFYVFEKKDDKINSIINIFDSYGEHVINKILK